MNREDEVKKLDKRISRIRMLGTPGAVFIGLGLYGVFGASGDAFHPYLNNQAVVNGLLIAGFAIEVWSVSRLIPMWRKRRELTRG